jgi:HlyD family secretion protein
MNNIFDRLNKRNIAIAIVIVLLLIGFSKSSKVQGDDYINPYISEIREEIRGSGVLRASSMTEVYSPTKGIIKSIFVQSGDVVKAGDKLFEVTSTATEQEKAMAWAGLASARSAINTAESSKSSLQTQLEVARRAILDATNAKDKMEQNLLDRKDNPATGKSYTDAEKLAIESSLISARSNFQTLEKQYLDSDENIKSAQANLAQASLAYQATRDSVVKSPIDGKVFNLKHATGDSVLSELDREPVLKIGLTEEMTIGFQVSEFNVGKISVGQAVEINFDALPGVSLQGSVSGVDQVGATSLGTVTYGVLVRVIPSQSESDLIRPSMTANLTIITRSKNEALVIPRSAVKLTGGKHYVIKQNGEQKDTVVTLGIIGDDIVEVIDGIDTTDKVKKVFSH